MPVETFMESLAIIRKPFQSFRVPSHARLGEMIDSPAPEMASPYFAELAAMEAERK